MPEEHTHARTTETSCNRQDGLPLPGTGRDLFARALDVIPGGVNSPVRAFNAVGGTPIYAMRGAGATIATADHGQLTDYCCSWGPLILGHAPAAVVQAIQEAAAQGSSFGINTAREVEFAELLCGQIPYMDQVRLVNSGTEATMTALRLARGATGRDKILKFSGCYHGHCDQLLVSAGSGLLTSGAASSAGVSAGTIADVLVAPFNSLEATELAVHEHGPDLAAIIVEPIAGNMGLVPPRQGYLEGLRAAADRCGALLIFDEVITGFRLGATTYGALCGVTPDLTCLGKIIGGGMPIGAVGGKREIMEYLAPRGPVYQAGTLSGNPVAVAAGMATLQSLVADPPYERLAGMVTELSCKLRDVFTATGTAAHVRSLGSMFTIFFSHGEVECLADTLRCDTQRYPRFFHGMLDRGIYLPPSPFEVCFLSTAHTDQDIAAFVSAAAKTIG